MDGPRDIPRGPFRFRGRSRSRLRTVRSVVDRAEGVERELAEDTGVVEPAVAVEGVDRSHLVGGQLEIDQREVLREPFGAGRLRHDGCPALYAPPERDLC